MLFSFALPLIDTKGKTSEKEDPVIGFHQGYETGGLVYFTFEGKEMVAVIRDRSEFDKHLKRGTSLQSYANTVVSDKAYGAALAIVDLIPKGPHQ